MAVEDYWKSNHNENRKDLNLNNREAGAKHEIKGQQYGHQRCYSKVHNIGTKHVAIFRFKFRSTPGALVLKGEPVLENTASAAEWTFPHNRTNHPCSRPGEPVRTGIRYIRERAFHDLS